MFKPDHVNLGLDEEDVKSLEGKIIEKADGSEYSLYLTFTDGTEVDIELNAYPEGAWVSLKIYKLPPLSEDDKVGMWIKGLDTGDINNQWKCLKEQEK